MSDEGKDDVELVQPDKDGKHPETIPWDKYVGVKEAWGKAKAKVSSLEEQLKTTINAEEHNRVKGELETAKTTLAETQTELQGVKDKSTSEKRATLISRGIPEEDVKSMSEKEMDAVLKAVGSIKTKPDLGGGGGSGELKGSPMELAREAYSK